MGEQEKVYEKILNSIQEANKSQTLELKKYINSEINDLKDTIQKEQIERKQLETKYEELKNKYTILEKKLRKNNIIIFGLKSDNENLLTYIVDKINQHLNLNILPQDINNIFTVGKKENKPVTIQFVSFLKKIEVLRNCHKLKDTNISISEDLSIEEREKNKILRKHLAEARSKSLSAYIKKNKLYVSGVEYTPEQLEGNYTEEYETEAPTSDNNKIKTPLAQTSQKEASLIRKRSEEEKKDNTTDIDVPRQENKKKKTATTDIYNTARASSRLAEKDNVISRSNPKTTKAPTTT